MHKVALAVVILSVLPNQIRGQAQSRNPPVRALTTAQIAARAAPATVTIITIDAQGDTIGQGSGFLVRGDGTIVTNWHVLAGASRAIVILATQERFDRVTALDGDQSLDIAILKIPGYHLPTLETSAVIPDIGSRVIAIGSPLGLSQTVTEGIVSATRLDQGRELVQVSAAISPGSSGGAVLDGLGRVFAISSSFLRGGQQLNFAIPVRYALGLLSGGAREQPLLQFFAAGAPSAQSATATASSPNASPIAAPRSNAPRGSVSGAYSLWQESTGSAAAGRGYERGVLIADEHGGWLVLAPTTNDTISGPAKVYGAETFRTNSAGDVVLSAGGVTYDGYQTVDSGFFATGSLISPSGERFELKMLSTRTQYPLSAPTGLYDVNLRTAGYAKQEYVEDVDWAGDIAVAVARDTLYVDLYIANSAGGSAGVSGRSAWGSDGTFDIVAKNSQGFTTELRGTLRDGAFVATWLDERNGFRYQGSLRAVRK